jgi:hypothetical protein
MRRMLMRCRGVLVGLRRMLMSDMVIALRMVLSGCMMGLRCVFVMLCCFLMCVVCH